MAQQLESMSQELTPEENQDYMEYNLADFSPEQLQQLLNFQQQQQMAQINYNRNDNFDQNGAAGATLNSDQLNQLNNDLNVHNILTNQDMNSKMNTQNLQLLQNFQSYSANRGGSNISPSIGRKSLSPDKNKDFPQLLSDRQAQNPQNRVVVTKQKSENNGQQTSKNKKLIDELMHLKEEIKNLKNLQNEHLHLSIQNQSQNIINSSVRNYNGNSARNFTELQNENQMLKEALAQRDKELYNQKMEIENQKQRIDGLEQMIQQMGQMLYKSEQMDQDEALNQDLNIDNDQDLNQYQEEPLSQNLKTLKQTSEIMYKQNHDEQVTFQGSQKHNFYIDQVKTQSERSVMNTETFQDVSQIMNKIDENRNKRSQIESYLNNQQIANINDQRIFAQNSQIYVQSDADEGQYGPITLKNLYDINQSLNGQKRSSSFHGRQPEKQQVLKGYMMKPQTYRPSYFPQEKKDNAMSIQSNFDAAMIQKLFPDRAIKAQKFIDLLACNRNEKQQQLRVQNPLQRKAQDLDMALKEFLVQLEENNIKINMRKCQGGPDPYIYQLDLPEGKTSGLRPRSSRNRYGAPYSHLPQDRVMTQKVKLSLSGGQIMVKQGGGYTNIMEFLENKGFFQNVIENQ